MRREAEHWFPKTSFRRGKWLTEREFDVRMRFLIPYRMSLIERWNGQNDFGNTLQECCKGWKNGRRPPVSPPFPPCLFKRLRIVTWTSKKEGFYRFFIEKKARFQRRTKKAVTNRKLRPKCLKLKHYAIPEIHPCMDAFSFTFAAVSIINHQIISN